METRTSIEARWTNAYTKAQTLGITPRQLAGCGAWIVPSAKDAATAYETTMRTCKCPSGLQDLPCWHKAAVRIAVARQAIGELESLGWECPDNAVARAISAADWMTSTGAAAPTVPCPLCHGADPRCGLCGGEGEVDGAEPTDCPDCSGEGYRRMPTGFGLGNWVAVPCPCGAAPRKVA